MKQKIEDGVPIPAARGGANTANTELLRRLKVGQSFLITKAQKNSIHTSARFVFGESGHIATRIEGDFVRVWRIR